MKPRPFVPLCLVLAAASSAQTTTRVSVGPGGLQADADSFEELSVSADGSTVAFTSVAKNLVPGDSNDMMDVFVHDLDAGTTSRVSVSTSGKQCDGHCAYPSLSESGRFVAFSGGGTNLVSGDVNGVSDVFVHDRETGETTRVSVSTSGEPCNKASFQPTISADGRFVCFNSLATNLVTNDTNDSLDVFVHDRATGTTRRVSMGSGGVESDDPSYEPRISANGETVTFYSYATNLVPGDTNDMVDVFVHDIATGLVERVSVSSLGEQANEKSWTGGISADGQRVAFTSFASNLVPGDTNGTTDVFVYDRGTGTVERVSRPTDGAESKSHSETAVISGDGRHVAFSSYSDNLVDGDTNGGWDIFLHDTFTGKTERISVDSDGVEGDDYSLSAALSHEGRIVAFHSWATNLVDGDTNGEWDIFVRDRTLAALGENYCGPANLNSSGMSAAISADGSDVVSDNDVRLHASFLPQHQFGYFLNSPSKGFVANPGNSQGNLCLGGAIGRYAKSVESSGPGGELELQLDLTDTPTPNGPVAIQPGETWHFQAWFRDKNPTQTSNFTDGLTITFG